VRTTHTGLVVSCGGLNDGPVLSRAFVQTRILQAKEIREIWKGVAVLLLPIPRAGQSQYTPVAEFDQCTEEEQGVGATIGEYWRSAQMTAECTQTADLQRVQAVMSTIIATDTTDSTTTKKTPIKTTTSISACKVAQMPMGFAVGADGMYSILLSDIAYSPDFMDANGAMVMTTTAIGLRTAKLIAERGGMLKGIVLYTTLANVLALIIVAVWAYKKHHNPHDVVIGVPVPVPVPVVVTSAATVVAPTL
jgi:hypothetical protein